MKSRSFLFFLIVSFFLVASNHAAAELTYNRDLARNYARDWCNGFNPKYIFIPGTDCANFDSQALIEGFGGGDPFGCVKNSDIIGKDGTTKGVTGAARLIGVLTDSFCFRRSFSCKKGDIVAYKNAAGNIRHVAIVDENCNIAAHTNSHCFSAFLHSRYDEILI